MWTLTELSDSHGVQVLGGRRWDDENPLLINLTNSLCSHDPKP